VILERRRRIEQALHVVMMKAWVNGVSTRAVDELLAAVGWDRHLQVGGVTDLWRSG
jgi:transposase-like protein